MAQTGSPLPPDGDVSRAPAVMIPLSITVGIAFVLFCLRMILRVKSPQKLGLDDLFIVLGMVTTILVLVFFGIAVHYGMGRHSVYIPIDDQIESAKWQIINQGVAIFSAMFTRLSICFFLLRIFTTGRKEKYIIYGIIALVSTTGVASGIAVFCECQPIQATWNPLIHGNCWSAYNKLAKAYFQGATVAFAELVLAILPIVFLWDVQINLKTKIGICCLMGMGIFTFVCTIVRTVLLTGLVAKDITFNEVDLNIWVGLELSVALIAANIPALRPLSRMIFAKYREYRTRLLRERTSYATLGRGNQSADPRTEQPNNRSFASKPDSQNDSSRAASTISGHGKTSLGQSSSLSGIRKTTSIELAMFEHQSQ